MKSHIGNLLRVAGRAALGAGLALLAATPAAAEKVRNHFDTDSIMRAPGFFEFPVLGAPAAAKWLVLSDRNPPSAPAVAVQVEAGRPDASVAAAVRRTYAYLDGTTSTYFKTGGARSGLVVRYVDEKNYVLILVDGNTGEAVLTSVRDGKFDVLGHGKGSFTEKWQKVSLEAAGSAIRVSIGDAAVLQGTDPHPVSGRVGLATSGPGEARFDELILDSPEIKTP